MNGRRPPRRGEPRSGESSLPHRQILKNRPDGRFFALGKNYQLISKREGENPRRVRAEQLATMNGRRPPRRGEPRSGESSLPHRQMLKNRPDGRFFAFGKNYQLMSKREGENPRRVRAEQLAAMNGRRPPRRGEPRSGESSLPHRQMLKNRPDGRFFAFGKNYQLMLKREGENPRRVRAEQLAAMNGRRPPQRGEPRSGESSLPHRQI